MSMDQELGQCRDYEEFVKRRLYVDLQSLQSKRETLVQKIHDYDNFIASLKHLQSQNLTHFNCHAPLGCGVAVQAHVPDASHVFVHVGLGVYVDCSLAEAIEKVTFLKSCHESQLEVLHGEIGELRASIDFMEAGIAALVSSKDTLVETDSRNAP